MIRVVLDTNVLVSANLKAQGLQAQVVSLALNSQLQLYISEPIVREYNAVLRYPRLKFKPRDVSRFLGRLYKSSIVVTPSRTLSECGHEPDNRFLECAEAAHADFLVTGNKRHFPNRWKETKVVNARELLASLPTSGK